jgi:hypothetical protein
MSDLGTYDIQIRFGFPDEFSHLLALSAADAAALFPNSLHALKRLADAAEERWRGIAEGAIPLDSGKIMHKWGGEYSQSISTKPVTRPTDGSLIGYEISSSDPKAYWLEVGTSAWDMRKLLNTSHKVRQTAEGKRYLVMPFRWGTPGTLVVGAYVNREMPESVHQFMLTRIKESFVTGTYQEASILDPNVSVTRYRYQWGDHLTPNDVASLGLDPNDKPGKHMVGMYRFNDPEAGRHAHHTTFRTLSDNSAPGTWIHPGTEPHLVAASVTTWVERVYRRYMESALDADVARLIQQATDAAP